MYKPRSILTNWVHLRLVNLFQDKSSGTYDHVNLRDDL